MSCFTQIGIRYFGLYAVGESTSVNCNDLAGNATLLQWLDDAGNVVASSIGGSVTLQINPITDTQSGQVYRCRLYNVDVLRNELTFQIIAFGEYNTILYCMYYIKCMFTFFHAQCQLMHPSLSRSFP